LTTSAAFGAGMVAEGCPRHEQQECINKAKALLRAAKQARRFASAAKRGQ
jgi:anthranilate synthase component I